MSQHVKMPAQNLLRLFLLLRIMLATVCYRFRSWRLVLKINFCSDFAQGWSRFWSNNQSQLPSLRKLFTAFSSCCDIIMHLVSLTAIKSTKQEWLSQWVSDKDNQWSDSGPIKSVRCVGIFRIWWAQAMIAVIGVFLAPNYRPTISLSWPRVGSASNFNQTLGRLNRRKENICLACSTIREFGGSRRKIARNCVARTRLRGRGSQTNSTIKRFRTFVGSCFQMDLKLFCYFLGEVMILFIKVHIGLGCGWK